MRWKEKASKMAYSMWRQFVGYDVERETKKRSRSFAYYTNTEHWALRTEHCVPISNIYKMFNRN